MRTRSFIFVAAFLAVLVVSGGALYAYDHARANEIAPGVKVGGVALGGLTPDEAPAQAASARRDPPAARAAGRRRPRGQDVKLGPREARLRANLGAMADEALARSRTGNIFARSWRSLSGERMSDDLRPDRPVLRRGGHPPHRQGPQVGRAPGQGRDREDRRHRGRHGPGCRGPRRRGLAAAPSDRCRHDVDDGVAHLRGQDAPQRSRRSARMTSSASTTRSSSSTAASSACGFSRRSSPRRPTAIAVGQIGLETPAGSTPSPTRPRTRPGTCPTARGPASWPGR